MSLKRKSLLWLAIGSASLLAQTAPSTTPNSAPTIKVNVQNVILDVTVYDGNGYTRRGNPVTGLHQGDFEVLEDGKAQHISFFEEHTSGPEPRFTPPTAPGTLTNVNALDGDDALTVILLAPGSMGIDDPSDQMFVHAELVSYLKTAQPGKPIALFTLAPGLRMLHGFTTDPAQLLAVLNSREPGAGIVITPAEEVQSTPKKRTQTLTAVDARANATSNLTTNLALRDQLEAFQQKMLELQTAQLPQTTLGSFQEIAHFLAPLPGRKSLIWIGGGFALDPDHAYPFHSDSSDKRITSAESKNAGYEITEEEIKKTANDLRAARVAVYPIWSRGIVGSIALAPLMWTMDGIADQTGGEAYYNTTGIQNAVERVVSQANGYYTLAYTPAQKRADGAYRKIEVRYKGHSRRAYRVAFWHGYYTGGAVESEGMAETKSPLGPLMDPVMPDLSQITFQMQVQPSGLVERTNLQLAGQNRGLARSMGSQLTRYTVKIIVPANEMTFAQQADGLMHGNLMFDLVAYNQMGHAVNWISEQLQPTLTLGAYEKLRRNGLKISEQIDLPEGAYAMKAGIYDLGTRKAGTLAFPLTVLIGSARTDGPALQ